MSDQTIFKENEEIQETPEKEEGGNSNTQNVQTTEPFADLLKTIKNERGEPKYNDPVKALEALKHSQEYIPQLKQENTELRSKLEDLQRTVEKLKTVEDSVQKLTANQNDDRKTSGQVFDEQSIADLLERTLSKREIEARQKANISQVTKSLMDKFGADAEKVFYSKAGELGMDAVQINGLAASSPQAVLQLFGIDNVKGKNTKMPSPISEGVNTTGFQPSKDTLVTRNKKSLSLGATSQEYLEEYRNSGKMLEELEENGISIDELTDPKKYFATFK